MKTNCTYSVLVAGRLPSIKYDAENNGIYAKELVLSKVKLAKTFSMWAFVEELKQYQDVKVIIANCCNLKYVPKVDFVVFIGYNDNWNAINKSQLRNRSNCIKIVSLLDAPYNDSDWSYAFRGNRSDNITVFAVPVYKPIYRNVPKKPKSILIDHCWAKYLGTEKEWTARIQTWLEPISKDYTIYRLIRFPEERKTLKHFEIPIAETSFPDYLARTDTVETFIVTHQETYGFSIIDMIARGIRVFAPPSFLLHLAPYFGLPEFANQEELLKLIESPVNGRWNKMIDKCTDYSVIVKTMDSDFRRWKQQDNSRRN